MSKVKIEGNASGTGTLTISAPNTDTDRSLTLPDGAGEIVVSSGGALPALDGSALTGISAGGLVKVAEVEADNTSSSIAIDSCFTSTYKNYFYMIDGLITNANSAGVNCYFRSGGSNLTASSYRTHLSGGQHDSSNTTSTAIAFGDWNGTIGYFTIGGQYDDGLGLFSYGYIFQPQIVDQTMLRGEVVSPHTTTNNRNFSVMIQYMGQTAIDGFRIDASSGNIQAGKLKIYGVVD